MDSEKVEVAGGRMIVDADRFEWFSGFRWYVDKDGYAVCTFYHENGQCTIRAHHLVIGQPVPPLVTDHINGDGLDNRRSNLRVVTRSQNAQNRGPVGGRQFKGVSARDGRWRAQIRVDGRTIVVGKYDTEQQAAIAWNKAALQYHGEFAYQNEVRNAD